MQGDNEWSFYEYHCHELSNRWSLHEFLGTEMKKINDIKLYQVGCVLCTL